MVCFQGAFLASVVACARALQIPSGWVDNVGPERPFKDLDLPSTEKAYKNVRRQAVELQNAIETQENTSLQEMRSRTTMFGKRLAMQQKAIEVDESINNATRGRQGVVRKEIEDLRGEAAELMTGNEALARQLKVMQKNISTALEFVNASVLYAVQRTGVDPNLEVLDELHQQDAKKAHSQELDDFGRLASLSMLITGNATDSVAKTPEEFINILRSNLVEAVAERNASLARLDTTFKRLYSQGEQKHNWVLRMQDELNQSLSQDIVTKERLELAVSHLKQSKEVLSDKVEALRRFGRDRLGEADPEPPTSAIQPSRKQRQSLGRLNEERDSFEFAEDGPMNDYRQPVGDDLRQDDTYDFVDESLPHDQHNASHEGASDLENFADGESEISLQGGSHDATFEVENLTHEAPKTNV